MTATHLHALAYIAVTIAVMLIACGILTVICERLDRDKHWPKR